MNVGTEFCNETVNPVSYMLIEEKSQDMVEAQPLASGKTTRVEARYDHAYIFSVGNDDVGMSVPLTAGARHEVFWDEQLSRWNVKRDGIAGLSLEELVSSFEQG